MPSSTAMLLLSVASSLPVSLFTTHDSLSGGAHAGIARHVCAPPTSATPWYRSHLRSIPQGCTTWPSSQTPKEISLWDTLWLITLGDHPLYMADSSCGSRHDIVLSPRTQPDWKTAPQNAAQLRSQIKSYHLLMAVSMLWHILLVKGLPYDRV